MKMRTEDGTIVEFYPKMILNDRETKEQGRPIYQKKHYINIITPGDRLTDYHSPVRDDHIAQFAEQWKIYMEAPEGTYGEGTPLEQWNLISREQAEELKFYKIYTVEDLANLSDTNANSCGINAVKYRQMAIDFLVASKRQADVGLNAELMRQNRELSARLEALERAGVNIQEPATPNKGKGTLRLKEAVSDAA